MCYGIICCFYLLLPLLVLIEVQQREGCCECEYECACMYTHTRVCTTTHTNGIVLTPTPRYLILPLTSSSHPAYTSTSPSFPHHPQPLSCFTVLVAWKRVSTYSKCKKDQRKHCYKRHKNLHNNHINNNTTPTARIATQLYNTSTTTATASRGTSNRQGSVYPIALRVAESRAASIIQHDKGGEGEGEGGRGRGKREGERERREKGEVIIIMFSCANRLRCHSSYTPLIMTLNATHECCPCLQRNQRPSLPN